VPGEHFSKSLLDQYKCEANTFVPSRGYVRYKCEANTFVPGRATTRYKCEAFVPSGLDQAPAGLCKRTFVLVGGSNRNERLQPVAAIPGINEKSGLGYIGAIL
jgi:hypothetical protein